MRSSSDGWRRLGARRVASETSGNSSFRSGAGDGTLCRSLGTSFTLSLRSGGSRKYSRWDNREPRFPSSCRRLRSDFVQPCLVKLLQIGTEPPRAARIAKPTMNFEDLLSVCRLRSHILRVVVVMACFCAGAARAGETSARDLALLDRLTWGISRSSAEHLLSVGT